MRRIRKGRPHNPRCRKCRIAMVKKGRVKDGEKRYRCTKCGAEQ